MKIFLKRLVISLLALTAGFAGNQAWTTHPKEIASIQIAQAQTQLVPVVLPCSARAFLKSGGSKSGRLTGVDAKSQQLTLSQGKNSEQIAIAQIEKVTFYPSCDTSVVNNTRSLPPIRGERRTWSGIPLNNLRIRDGNKGRAEVSLPTGVDSRISKDRGSIYVVEEFSFVPSSKMNVSIVVVK
jgi:hypothetical protein